jgi:hypothetical protein
VTVIVAFALARGSGSSHEATPSGPPPPITVAAPPSNAAAEAPCAQVLSALPVKLGPLAPRAVHTEPDSPFVVAWGDPPVVLRCGVARPAALTPGSSELVFLLGVYWLPVQEKSSTVFTSVDRSVYVEVRVPKKMDYQPLPVLGRAIASKLKAICAVPEDDSTYRPDQLCTHRQ